jgi:myosin protein heavy chain
MNSQLNDEVNKARDRIERLLKNIEELQQDDTETQLQFRRAERELRDEREKVLYLERELENWKARNTTITRSPMPALSETGSRRGSAAYGYDTTPQRKPSNTKGFL